MEKIKKFISAHKPACIIGGIVLILLLIILLIFMIAPPIGDNNYGDRLKHESKYKVSNSTIDEIKDTISKEDGVDKITYHKEGRVLNFTVNLEDGVVLDTAKGYASKIIETLKEKNLKYYDVQIFLDGEGDDYPIIGYHAKGSENISWGNVGGN